MYVTVIFFFFFFQAEDGIRDLVRSRGLGDVYKRQTAKDALWRAAQKLPIKTAITARDEAGRGTEE